MARRDEQRSGESHSLADFLPAERRRIMDGASKARQEQMRAAEATREVYRAWNEVCANTREGSHVTGLHYVPESNELIVYADGSSWVGELTMMREIIRARMYRCGADVSNIKVLLSRGDHRPARPNRTASDRAAKKRKTVSNAHRLSAAEEAALDEEVSPIEDDRLRQALKSAMKASLEYKVSNRNQNGA